MRLLPALFALWLTLPAALPAQRLAVSPFPSIDQTHEPPAPRLAPPEPDLPQLVMGGILGGAAGLAAGAMVGRQIGDEGCEDCWADEVFWGAVVGASVGLATGVHLANGRRGSLANAALASLVIGAGGLLAAGLADGPALLLAIPIFQIAGAITIEREGRPEQDPDDPI